jgi:hypothetical protein
MAAMKAERRRVVMSSYLVRVGAAWMRSAGRSSFEVTGAGFWSLVGAATLRGRVRRQNANAWAAIVLVLLHVFAPALHALSHRHGRPMGSTAGNSAGHGGGHIAARAGVDAPTEVRLRAPRTRAELLPTAADDSCPLCDELQRTHGYTAAVDLPLAAAEAVCIAPRAEQGAIRTAQTDARPPARAPPRLLDC